MWGGHNPLRLILDFHCQIGLSLMSKHSLLTFHAEAVYSTR